MKSLTFLLGRLAILLGIEFRFLFGAPGGFLWRVGYLIRKYWVMLRGGSTITFYTGQPFSFDNRFTPILLQEYPTEIRTLANVLNGMSEIETILDVGANIGQFAATIRRYHPEIRLLSFEPNPEIFPLLQSNLAHLGDCRQINAGVAETSGTMSFFFVPGKSAQGSISAQNATDGLLAEQANEIKVEMQPVDEAFVSEYGFSAAFDLVKIDVEGAELHVLRGLRGIKFRYLYMEVSSTREGGTTLEAVQDEVKAVTGQDSRLLFQEKRHVGDPYFNVVLELVPA